MGKNQRPSKIICNDWLGIIITGLAFLKYIFRDKGLELDAVLVVVADDSRTANRFKKKLRDANAVVINKLNQRKIRPYNFQAGLYLYRKYDKEEDVLDFINQEDFLPVVLAVGIVPEFLLSQCYVFHLDQTNFNGEFLEESFHLFREFVIENINLVQKEINELETSKVLQSYKRNTEFFLLFKILIAVGVVWKSFLRKYNTEITMESWYVDYIRLTEEAVANFERFEAGYDVSDTVVRIIHAYIRKESELCFADIKEVTGHVEEALDYGKAILSDSDFYYIQEALLKKICQPILSGISIVQLKKELAENGILVCNNTNGNYTVKKIFYNTETGTKKRCRFLKIKKEDLETDEGFSLEEWYEYCLEEKREMILAEY